MLVNFSRLQIQKIRKIEIINITQKEYYIILAHCISCNIHKKKVSQTLNI